MSKKSTLQKHHVEKSKLFPLLQLPSENTPNELKAMQAGNTISAINAFSAVFGVALALLGRWSIKRFLRPVRVK